MDEQIHAQISFQFFLCRWLNVNISTGNRTRVTAIINMMGYDSDTELVEVGVVSVCRTSDTGEARNGCAKISRNVLNTLCGVYVTLVRKTGFEGRELK